MSRINAAISTSHVDDFRCVLVSMAIRLLIAIVVIYGRAIARRTRQNVAVGTSRQNLAFFGTEDGDGRALIRPVSVVQIGLAVTNVCAQEAKARAVVVVVFELEQHAAAEGRGAGLPMILHVLNNRFVCFLQTPMNTNTIIDLVLTIFGSNDCIFS